MWARNPYQAAPVAATTATRAASGAPGRPMRRSPAPAPEDPGFRPVFADMRQLHANDHRLVHEGSRAGHANWPGHRIATRPGPSGRRTRRKFGSGRQEPPAGAPAVRSRVDWPLASRTIPGLPEAAPPKIAL